MTAPPCVVAIVGPTATGKSALSLQLAHALGGEVVNADSMQLYRGMDIGTAKLTSAEREGVPHHVLDLWDVTEPASVAEYQRAARAAIDDIRARGRVALVVGGSGLYVRAALDRFEFPGTDPAVRGRLEAELQVVGAPAMHARLAARDPEAAARILPSNARRIVRALEVLEITGGPFVAQLPEYQEYYEGTIFLGLDLDPAVLDERVAQRVERMWQAGFVEEVRALERAGLRQGRTASRALGYQQVLAFLAGEIDEQTAKVETIRATRRFVRRQRSWFGRDPRIFWLDAAAPDLVDSALAVVRARCRTGQQAGESTGDDGGR